VNIPKKKGPLYGPKWLVLFTFLSSLGLFFGFDPSPNGGTLFILDLHKTCLAALVFFDGVTYFGFDLFRSLFKFALSFAEAAGKLGNLRAAKEKEGYSENCPDYWAVKHGEREVHRFAVAGIV